MAQQEQKMFLRFYAASPIHAGAGASTSVVDLPIQRERHTHWPHIQASGVKGALRDHFRTYADNVLKNGKAREYVNFIFGLDEGNDGGALRPNVPAGSNTPGVISVSDAKILAFPMRASAAPFVYVTCPAVLRRLSLDWEFVTGKPLALGNLDVDEGKARPVGAEWTAAKEVILEDLLVTVEAPKVEVGEAAKLVGEEVKPLLLIHDNDFSYAVSYCTEIQPHIKIDTKTGTVQSGALWYQELLPANSLLYSVVYFSASAFDSELQAEAVAQAVTEGIRGFVQVGGDASLGRGLCKITWVNVGGGK